jgi:hypothetical protein
MTTEEQTDQAENAGKTAGLLAGSLSGAVLGGRVIPVPFVGPVVGAVVGAAVGSEVGTASLACFPRSYPQHRKDPGLRGRGCSFSGWPRLHRLRRLGVLRGIRRYVAPAGSLHALPSGCGIRTAGIHDDK